jgi:hypoxanthine phosphoribosyltransferase
MYIINNTEYTETLELLKDSVQGLSFDCIVALKRSGWMLGVFLSNKLTRPVFTPAEIKSIPKHFNVILVVDDAICKGKSFKTVTNKLAKMNKRFITAAMYVEGTVLPDVYIHNVGHRVRMWYENLDIQN